jgi:hypothetical protein
MKRLIFAALLSASMQVTAALPNPYFSYADPLDKAKPRDWEVFQHGSASAAIKYPVMYKSPGSQYYNPHVRIVVTGAVTGSFAGIKVDALKLQSVTPGQVRRFTDKYLCTARWPVVMLKYDAGKRFIGAVSIARTGTINGRCDLDRTNSTLP